MEYALIMSDHCRVSLLITKYLLVMKNTLNLCMLLVGCLFIFSACQKEDQPLVVEETVSTPTDEIQMRIPINAQLAKPDLVVISVSSDMPIGTCVNGPKPSTVCGSVGGSFPFVLTCVVKNIGNGPLQAGQSYRMNFDLLSGGQTNPQYTSVYTSVGGTFTITSPQYSLPCPTTGPPFQIGEQQFLATVDSWDEIDEVIETNNTSRPYIFCDDF